MYFHRESIVGKTRDNFFIIRKIPLQDDLPNKSVKCFKAIKYTLIIND